MTPCASLTAWRTPGRNSDTAAIPTGATRPGAMGACKIARAVSSGARSTRRPHASLRETGCSSPAIDDSPIASASAKATKIWLIDSGCHTALAPTHTSLQMDTSTTAMSCRPPLSSTHNILLRTVPSAVVTRPVATNPAANPAMVASLTSGNTLFVPVESARIGVSPHARAANRCVPSPPSTTITLTPKATMRSIA